MRRIRNVCAFLLAAVTAAALTACGGGDDTAGNADGPVTFTWWHNGTTDTRKALWEQIAADYQAANPGVSFKIEPVQNEQFQTKIPLALQSDSPPDIYQQWGGGQGAGQLASGKVADITGQASPWIGQLGPIAQDWAADGKQYGVPYVGHTVGFWYRKDIFANAGITTPPTTMEQLNEAVAKLKGAGVAPIAVGGKDRWPDAFYWGYLATRHCAPEELKKAVESVRMEHPCWLRAGQDLKAFLDTQPFQTGFVGTPAQQGAGSSAGMVANGQAAMELQGDWSPDTMASLTSDKDLNSKLGWFPFPSVAGGAGAPGAILAGGDGFSCTQRTGAACAKFLQYLTTPPVQEKLAAIGAGLPVNPAAAPALGTDSLKSVFEHTQQAPHRQTYFDIALPTSVGQALNDAIANFFAGQGTPESIVQAVNSAAAGNK
ncbi:ABC transporter substrate-binding protein [Amycolatopsis sp. 195334CR]|uniref:ABC transporter substrate-binding protein n=1 Tax=Amycolatopsis sp. 195334CR TaxID=2814588 RepID=UPI001A900654|nr:extracellular solute-binding protein [Amycolatopsis sp. 195334CR]MBN6041945.1 extracellular solute-binding protein [Amycolatopsis sp. 195334CR]